jgi:hypothetical protein
LLLDTAIAVLRGESMDTILDSIWRRQAGLDQRDTRSFFANDTSSDVSFHERLDIIPDCLLHELIAVQTGRANDCANDVEPDIIPATC